MARQIRKKSGTGKAFLLQSQGIANPLMIQSLEKVRRNVHKVPVPLCMFEERILNHLGVLWKKASDTRNWGS